MIPPELKERIKLASDRIKDQGRQKGLSGRALKRYFNREVKKWTKKVMNLD